MSPSTKAAATRENFVIYGGSGGYVAVTNPIRQQILAALQESEQSLTALVKLTGKAKSTLSAVHLKDLIERGLVDERPDPSDSRAKLYKLKGTRIGSSSIPVDELREAVKDYVTSAQGALALPFAIVVQAFDSMPPLEPAESRWVGLFGERLGALTASRMRASEPAGLLAELADGWKREGLGSVAKVKAGASGLEITHAAGASPGGARCALLRGFLQGVLTTRIGRAAWVQEPTCSRGKDKRCTFEIGWASA